MSVHQPVKRLKYMTRFECIGSKCEDDCCSQLNHYLDRADYANFEKLAALHPDFAAKLKHNVHVLAEDQQDEDTYAVLYLNEKGNCYFLENGICSIHRDYGHRELNKVCATYPRKFFPTADGQVMAGSLGCPEAARLALLAEDAMEIDHQRRDIPDNSKFPRLPHNPKDPYYSHVLTVRDTVVELLKDRNTPFYDRSLLVLKFLKDIDGFYHRGLKEDPAPQLQAAITALKDPNQSAAFLQDHRNEHQVTPPAMLLFNLVILDFFRYLVDWPRLHPHFLAFMSYPEMLSFDLATNKLPRELDGVAFEALNPEDAFLPMMWPTYQNHKQAAFHIEPDLLDRYLTHISIYFWLQDAFVQSKSPLIHARHWLISLAMVRFFFCSDLEIRKACGETAAAKRRETFDRRIVAVTQPMMRYTANAALRNLLSSKMDASHFNTIAQLQGLLNI